MAKSKTNKQAMSKANEDLAIVTTEWDTRAIEKKALEDLVASLKAVATLAEDEPDVFMALKT